MLVGGQLSGTLFNRVVSGEGHTLMENWKSFWLGPCIAAAVIMVIFFILFRDDAAPVKQTVEAAAI